MTDPCVAIVIVNWNGREDTLACLDSLKRLEYSNYIVVLVDNASKDGTPEVIRQNFPEVVLIETGANLGFVGGNNAGMEYAFAHGADYALLLNNDTEVAPDFLRILVAAADSDPEAGIAGPTIYYYQHPEMIWFAGGEIDWRRGDSYTLGIGEIDRGQFGIEPHQVGYITGCALLIKRAVVERVGKLDPRFFAYYEETEWCVRVSQAGYKILYVPQAHIWHKVTLDAREASPTVQYYMTRNRLLFLKLTGAGLRPWLNTLLIDFGMRLVSWTIKPRWRHKRLQRNALLRALYDFSRGSFGAAQA